MSYEYKQRNLNEAIDLAQSVFKSKVENFLTSEEMEEMVNFGAMVIGTISDDWETVLEHKPDSKKYYEINLYKPAENKSSIEKFYARILVIRDFSSEQVEIIWKPEI